MRAWSWIEIKMTKFCVEDIFIEELKEQDLNAADLLQERAKKQKTEVTIEYEIDDGLLTLMKKHDIDVVLEILDAIRKDIEMHGKEFEVKVIRKKEQC